MDTSGEWMKLFQGLDVAVMAAIAVVALMLERARAVPDRWAVLVPLALGGLWGLIWGLDQQAVDGASLKVHILKGVLLNGAGASVAARLAKPQLDKLWPTAAVAIMGLSLFGCTALQQPTLPTTIDQGIVAERVLVADAYSTTAALLRSGFLSRDEAVDIMLGIDRADATLTAAAAALKAGKSGDAQTSLAAATGIVTEIRKDLERRAKEGGTK